MLLAATKRKGARGGGGASYPGRATPLFAKGTDGPAPAPCIGFAFAAILLERRDGGAEVGRRGGPRGNPTATPGGGGGGAFGLARAAKGAPGALMRNSHARQIALAGTLALWGKQLRNCSVDGCAVPMARGVAIPSCALVWSLTPTWFKQRPALSNAACPSTPLQNHTDRSAHGGQPFPDTNLAAWRASPA